jgi:hypothetical protein
LYAIQIIFIVWFFVSEGDIEDKIGRFFASGVCLRSDYFIVPVIRLAGWFIEDTPPV